MIIFPSDPFNSKEPDDSFRSEYEAALAAGFKIGLVHMELLLGGEARLTLPEGYSSAAIYRGWILKPDQCVKLSEALPPPMRLVNSPANYEFLYSLPNWMYLLNSELVPKTFVITGSSEECQQKVNDGLDLSHFGDHPLIVKDFLKSRKHEWFDACYISSALDTDEVKRVTTNLIEGQGSDFAGGLAYREFISLKKIGIHSKSRMPLTLEHRYFMRGQEILARYNYWSEGEYDGSLPPESLIKEIARKVDLSRFVINDLFYTIDIAQKENGDWVVIELGDGGSCGIPENGDPNLLYSNLKRS